MIVVGLTGGIGSGKSTVADLFSKLDVPIYFADIEAKKLMTTSKIIKWKLTDRFGKDVYKNDELNRPFLANLIFTNTANLAFVNAVVHPKVAQHFNRWIKKQEKLANTAYVIQENAILFENGSYLNFDKIITVTAPKNIKIERVINRDKSSKKQVEDRMNNQWSDKKKIEKADFIIQNTLLEDTKKQVIAIHTKLQLMKID